MFTLDRDEVDLEAEISKLFGTLKKVKHGKPALQVIISCYSSGIYAVSNGKTLWNVSKKIIPEPRGVVLTSSGEVLVADYWSNRVLLVSSEGQEVETLLSADDGLHRPTGLAYSEKHHLLAVVEYITGWLKLYHF